MNTIHFNCMAPCHNITHAKKTFILISFISARVTMCTLLTKFPELAKQFPLPKKILNQQSNKGKIKRLLYDEQFITTAIFFRLIRGMLSRETLTELH